MQGIERPFGAISKGRVLKRVCCGPEKSRDHTRYPTSRESSSTPFKSDRGHPCYFKGYPSDLEERGTGSGSDEEWLGRATLREEVEVYLGAHCL